ncbi:uncharacterized protein [Rutidosis leptorrhynchoides]|uniref:uncharacterized protein n=1 Tax=Rutidosis leptorrhynchoides TaxID=125765 RepID=UPI003A9A0253
MVKAVVGEETQLNVVEDRLSQSSIPAQVGLVIGKLSSTLDKGFVYDLLPTPPNDAGELACSLIDTKDDNKKKGSKPKSQQPPDFSSLIIDNDWVAEHARQVTRMLVGGVHVIGIYIWVSHSAFKNSTMLLSQTVKGVAEAAPISGVDLDERLLIHISYSPRRWTCRNCVLSSNITSTSVRPCDFKKGRVLSSLQMYRSTYNFDIRLPLSRDNATNALTLGEVLRRGIAVAGRELNSSKATIDGKLVVNNDQCTADGMHEVEFLIPFMNSSVEASRQKDVIGTLVFRGSVISFAIVNSKELASLAVADIKDDIIRSLQSRLDIICDDAEENLESTLDAGNEASGDISSGKPLSHRPLHELRKSCNISLPRRIFVPWLPGTYICVYLQPSETIEVLKDHFVELISMEAPSDASKILEPELEAPSLNIASFWDTLGPSSSVPNNSTSSTKKKTETSSRRKEISQTTVGFNITSFTAAVFILLLSALVGYLLTKR